jgi:hypothetical protein
VGLFLQAFLISALDLLKHLTQVDYNGHAAQVEKNEKSTWNFGMGEGNPLKGDKPDMRIIMSDI